MRSRTTIFALLLLAGCSGGGDDRLIPTSDPQFQTLETPESTGECEEAIDCEESCVHSCIATTQGPITCPVEPTPRPERLVGATCICEQSRCKWD